MSRWSRLFGPDAAQTIDERRWVVLDVETTGLDMHHDELLAIAAVAVIFDDAATPHIAPHIDLSDSFEAVLHHDSASTDKVRHGDKGYRSLRWVMQSAVF